MNIKDFTQSKIISARWITAHFLKKLLVTIFFILFIPIVLISACVDLLSHLFQFIYEMLDKFFGLAFEYHTPFMIKFFELFGFKSGQIFLGAHYHRSSILKLKQVVEENDIKCYIIEEIHSRDDGGYFVRIIVSKKGDLNLLKLIFNQPVIKV